MKKLFSLAFAMLIFFSPIVANAAGAISGDEQRILDSLNQGVTTQGGQSFFFSATDIQQAENELKANDYDKATCDEAVAHINAARQLVIDNSAGITATSLENLLSQMPKHIQNQLLDHVLATAKALNLSVDGKGNITNNSGQKVFVPNTSKNPVVKTTGFTMTTAIITIIGLLSLTAVTGLLSRKTSVHC